MWIFLSTHGNFPVDAVPTRKLVSRQKIPRLIVKSIFCRFVSVRCFPVSVWYFTFPYRFRTDREIFVCSSALRIIIQKMKFEAQILFKSRCLPQHLNLKTVVFRLPWALWVVSFGFKYYLKARYGRKHYLKARRLVPNKWLDRKQLGSDGPVARPAWCTCTQFTSQRSFVFRPRNFWPLFRDGRTTKNLARHSTARPI